MIQNFKYYKPTLGHSWLIVVIVIAGSLIGGVLFPKGPQSASYALMMVFPFLFCWLMGKNARAAGQRPTRIDAPHFGKLPVAMFLLLCVIAMMAISTVSDPATSFIPMPDLIKDLFKQVFIDTPMWDMVLSTCILAPLCEEFLCRGMMLRGMLHQMSPTKAIVWSAALFAVMHLNPWQSIPAFLIGLFFGWVYWRTHSLWTTIFLHCFNNTLSTVLMRLFFKDMDVNTGLWDLVSPVNYVVIIAASAAVLIATLYILHEKTLPAKIQTDPEA